MSNKDDGVIRVKDLVMVIKDCGRCTCRLLGTPFVVTHIAVPIHTLKCSYADAKIPLEPSASGMGRRSLDNEQIQIPLSWLKKFPPQEELEKENAEIYGSV